jgi:hypothetical protein
MQNQPKRHHYIPQFFLKYFSQDQANLWSFDRVKKEYRYQDTRKIASENKFYTYTVKGKEENLEDLFGMIEGMAKPILDKLLQKTNITMQEKADFSMFLAALRVRIPDFKKWSEEGGEKMYKKYNKIVFSNRKYVEEMIKKSGKTVSKKEVDELIDFATNESRYTVKFPPGYWIGTMLKLSLDVANIFIDSNWDIYHFNKQYALVTSDNPVVLVPPKNYHPFYGYGLATPGTVKVISISSSVCLVAKELTRTPEIIHKDWNNKELSRWFNRITSANSDRFVFSPEEGKLEKLVKDTKIDTYLREQRVQVS